MTASATPSSANGHDAVPARVETHELLAELYPGRWGHLLFEAKPRAKEPSFNGWKDDALARYAADGEPEQHLAAIARHLDQGGNVGLAVPPGALVLDCDDQRSTASLSEALGDVPRQKTAHGCHFFVRAPDLPLTGRTKVPVCEGVTADLRCAAANYLIVEPSVHPNGFRYSFEVGLPLFVDTLEPLPGGILSRLGREFGEKDQPKPRGRADYQGIMEGGRNRALYEIGCALRRKGLDREAIDAALQIHNTNECRPPMDPSEVSTVAGNAAEWVPGDPVRPTPATNGATPPREADERVRRRWPVLWAEEADGTKGSDYVVDDLIHQGTFGQFYGPQGTLKTPTVLDMAARVAQGLPWRDCKTREGCTVYVAAEGSGGIEKRVAALYLKHPEIPARSIVVIRSAVNLLDPAAVADFTTQIVEEILPEMPGPVLFIVFDTQSQSMPGSKESGPEEFTTAESAIRGEVIPRVGGAQGGVLPAVGLVHHPGKDASKGARGTSSQTGNLDWILMCERLGEGREPLEDRLYQVTAEKVKDGEDQRTWTYRAELVEVGIREEDGKPILAPVMCPAMAPERAVEEDDTAESLAAIFPDASDQIVTGRKATVRLNGGKYSGAADKKRKALQKSAVARGLVLVNEKGRPRLTPRGQQAVREWLAEEGSE